MAKQDTLEVSIAEDGTITVLTDGVSMPNHKAADDFLAFATKLAGGGATRTKRREGHSHGNTHVHTHVGNKA